MAHDRITPCVHYVCKGTYSKGRTADHTGYCQKCDKYQPRAKVKHKNMKKEKIYKDRKQKYRMDDY